MVRQLEASGLDYVTGPDASGEVFFWCPFHIEGDTPDLRFNVLKRVWYCFPCGEGGGYHGLLDRLRELERQGGAS